MNKHLARVLLGSLALLALTTSVALAGGWAAITLDALPTQVIAGQPLSLGFMVRQHGQRPMTGLIPKIIATRPDTGEKLTAYAEAQGEAGHYLATLTFPSAGTWEWVINDGFVTSDALGIPGQPMPSLTVLTPAGQPGAAAPAPARVPASLPMVIGYVGLIGAVGALLVLARTRAAWAAALALVAALVSTTGFASAASRSAPAAAQAALSPSAETGRALFLAKGCVMCHAHDTFREARKTFADFKIGPNLSQSTTTPEYLRLWLKDPAAVKPNTEMPNLGLSADEIEALTAFLTSDADQ